jgi:hypothetical protein
MSIGVYSEAYRTYAQLNDISAFGADDIACPLTDGLHDFQPQ